MEQGQIQGLLSLLSDESEGIQAQVARHLRNMGPEGLSILALARDHEDPGVRDRAVTLRRGLSRELALATLAEESAKPEPNLLRYHRNLSLVEDPDLDLGALDDEIARLQAGARERLRGVEGLQTRGRTLAHYLHDEEGFVGNGEHYDDPRNSYLHHVLRRRVGIPISLSAIYLLVGRAAGLDMAGVGMPCHFLVRLQDASGDLLLDPFGGGRILTRDDVKALLSGFQRGFQDEYLRSVDDRALLTRALANLVRLHDQHGHDDELQRAASLMAALQSDNRPR